MSTSVDLAQLDATYEIATHAKDALVACSLALAQSAAVAEREFRFSLRVMIDSSTLAQQRRLEESRVHLATAQLLVRRLAERVRVAGEWLPAEITTSSVWGILDRYVGSLLGNIAVEQATRSSQVSVDALLASVGELLRDLRDQRGRILAADATSVPTSLTAPAPVTSSVSTAVNAPHPPQHAHARIKRTGNALTIVLPPRHARPWGPVALVVAMVGLIGLVRWLVIDNPLTIDPDKDLFGFVWVLSICSVVTFAALFLVWHALRLVTSAATVHLERAPTSSWLELRHLGRSRRVTTEPRQVSVAPMVTGLDLAGSIPIPGRPALLLVLGSEGHALMQGYSAEEIAWISGELQAWLDSSPGATAG